MRRFLYLLTLVCVAASASPILAGPIADSIAFQGRLTDASDSPVPDGSRELIISIWTDSLGGSMLHNEIVVITTSKGLYSTCVGCGSSTFPDIFDGQTLFLQTQLVGQPPMTPRTKLRSVPYAVSSGSVHSEWTNGVARGKGIIANKPASGNPHGFLVLDHDSDGDGHEDFIVTDSVNGESASSLIGHDTNSDGVVDASQNIRVSIGRIELMTRWKAPEPDGPESGINALVDADSASQRMSYDSDGDGLTENEIAQSSSTGQSSVTVKSSKKRFNLMDTFPQSWRVDAHDSDSASHVTTVLESDINTDGVADSRILQSTDTSGATQRLEKKGINAVNVKLAIASSIEGDEARHSLTNDSDDNGIPDGDIEAKVTPVVSYHAIKTKGTGAESNRSTITSTTDLDSATVVSSHDSDGDGVSDGYISERVQQSESKLQIYHGAGGDSSGFDVTVSADSSSISLIQSDPGGVSSATMKASDGKKHFEITTKRSDHLSSHKTSLSADSASAGMQIHSDANNDGVAESSITQICDSSQALAIWLSRKGFQYWRSTSDLAGRFTIATDVNDTTIDVHGEGRLGIGKPVDATKRIDVAGGAYCDGTTWVNASDANAKENFRPVDGQELLHKLGELEITQWNYKGDTETAHIGPTAQDFKETFGVGSDGKSISTIDPSGIALAAIKELNKKNERLEKENQTLRRELDELKQMVRDLAKNR